MSRPIKQIAIDFDGTLAYHEYPEIGNPIPGAIQVVKKLAEAGHVLILLTMRDDVELVAAKKWLKKHDLHFDYFNRNPMFETGSRKVYAHYYVDDHSVLTPLIYLPHVHRKPFIDWGAIERFFKEKELI